MKCYCQDYVLNTVVPNNCDLILQFKQSNNTVISIVKRYITYMYTIGIEVKFKSLSANSQRLNKLSVALKYICIHVYLYICGQNGDACPCVHSSNLNNSINIILKHYTNYMNTVEIDIKFKTHSASGQISDKHSLGSWGQKDAVGTHLHCVCYIQVIQKCCSYGKWGVDAFIIPKLV